MEAICIEGPARIDGSIQLTGAKNAALPALIAAFSADGPVILQNLPLGMKDVDLMIEILRDLGANIEVLGPDAVRVSGSGPVTHEVSPEMTRRIRSSLLLLSLLTVKCGRATLGFPGGCEIGSRKFDLHLMGLEALGAKTRVTENAIEVEAERLVGGDVNLPIATTTGTENIMLAACFAEGTTRIFNAHLSWL